MQESLCFYLMREAHCRARSPPLSVRRCRRLPFAGCRPGRGVGSLKNLSILAPGLCLLLALGCVEKRVESDGPVTLGATLEHPAARVSRAGARGAALQFLAEDGPAAEAGLEAGDLVQAIDGSPVEDPCGLELALADRRPGQEVTLTVLRSLSEAERFEATVTLAGALEFDGAACDSGQGAACHRLGILYGAGRKGENVLADPERAADFFRRACEGESAAGCADLGIMIQAADEARARELFRQACKGGSAAGCAHLAYLFATGRGVAKDDARAIVFYRQACSGGDGPGCYNFGLHLEKARGKEQDLSGALVAYERACDLGSFLGCTNLGFLHEKGLGTPADQARATAFYSRACAGNRCESGDPLACFNLGVLYRDGQGAPVDKAGAAAYFEQSCSGGNIYGCANLADLLYAGDGVAKNEIRALDLFRRACDGGHEVSCRNVEAIDSQQ